VPNADDQNSNEQREPTPFEIPVEIENEIKSMFDGLSIEEAKNLIYDVTNEIVADLKVLTLSSVFQFT
jgi:hypothetical protein